MKQNMEQLAQHKEFLSIALQEAKKSYSEGGIPIGAVIVRRNNIIGRGYNRRIQLGNPILHAEMDALQNAGRLAVSVYTECTLYTTLSPCSMCTGAILLYRIPHVVIGENRSLKGAEDLLRSRGVILDIIDDPACCSLLQQFISEHASIWYEDIGEGHANRP